MAPAPLVGGWPRRLPFHASFLFRISADKFMGGRRGMARYPGEKSISAFMQAAGTEVWGAQARQEEAGACDELLS